MPLPREKALPTEQRLAAYVAFERELRSDMEQLDISFSSVGGVLMGRIRNTIMELKWLIEDRPEDFHKFDTREHARRYPPKPPLPRTPRRSG